MFRRRNEIKCSGIYPGRRRQMKSDARLRDVAYDYYDDRLNNNNNNNNSDRWAEFPVRLGSLHLDCLGRTSRIVSNMFRIESIVSTQLLRDSRCWSQKTIGFFKQSITNPASLMQPSGSLLYTAGNVNK